MVKANGLPTTLYVKVESGGTGPDYFAADELPDDLVEMGETAKIGIYKLKRVKTWRGVAKEQK